MNTYADDSQVGDWQERVNYSDPKKMAAANQENLRRSSPAPDSHTPKQLKSQHVHQFVIPVEWQDFRSKWNEEYAHLNAQLGVFYPADMRKVTKLRCVCSEEISR